MTARESILAAVRRAKPAPTPLPPVAGYGGDASVETFGRALAAAGGRLVRGDLSAALAELGDGPRATVGVDIEGALAVDADTPFDVLAALNVFMCRSALGVAENGAVWLDDDALGHRAALFLAAHVAIALDPSGLVGTMHDAYARLGSPAGRFGLWVAGPSKTADIEQSLVVGAHGPLSLTLVIP